MTKAPDTFSTPRSRLALSAVFVAFVLMSMVACAPSERDFGARLDTGVGTDAFASQQTDLGFDAVSDACCGPDGFADVSNDVFLGGAGSDDTHQTDAFRSFDADSVNTGADASAADVGPSDTPAAGDA